MSALERPGVFPGDAEDAILLVGHGSRDLEGAVPFQTFAAALQRRTGVRVQPAFLEFNEPPILDAVRLCVEAGRRRLTVIPLFLGAATHQKNDVPAAVNLARGLYPDLTVLYGAPLGPHAMLAEAAGSCAFAALAEAGEAEVAGTAVLLVGRGSRDPDSNSDLFKVGRLVYEGRSFEAVEACYIAIAAPDLAAGVERCVRLGARCIVAVPYMLFTGVLVKRIEELLAGLRGHYPGVKLLASRSLGDWPELLAVVEERITQAIAGEAHANCDSCKYRLRLTGFESEYLLPQSSDHHHGLRSSL